MDALGSSSSRSARRLAAGASACSDFEEIWPGASVCPHCGSNLAPLQALADKQAALEERVAALERN